MQPTLSSRIEGVGVALIRSGTGLRGRLRGASLVGVTSAGMVDVSFTGDETKLLADLEAAVASTPAQTPLIVWDATDRTLEFVASRFVARGVTTGLQVDGDGAASWGGRQIVFLAAYWQYLSERLGVPNTVDGLGVGIGAHVPAVDRSNVARLSPDMLREAVNGDAYLLYRLWFAWPVVTRLLRFSL